MKEFTVKVTAITTMTVEAATEDEAIDKACEMAWEYDADEKTLDPLTLHRASFGPDVLRLPGGGQVVPGGRLTRTAARSASSPKKS